MDVRKLGAKMKHASPRDAALDFYAQPNANFQKARRFAEERWPDDKEFRDAFLREIADIDGRQNQFSTDADRNLPEDDGD